MKKYSLLTSRNSLFLKSKKGFLDISFSWLFAFLIGAVILFAAIFGATKFSKIEESKSSAFVGTDLMTLLSQLETGTESAKGLGISMPILSRINNDCDNYSTFGRQSLTIEEKIKGGWTENPVPIYFENKYIFSSKVEEGKNFFFMTFPFSFPFKVANLIYFFPEEKRYCFSNAPIKIRKQLSQMNNEIFVFEDCKDDKNMKQACFGDATCEINIEQENGQGFVKKGRDKVFFTDYSLMYAAIFSDKKIYECQVQRLMKRTAKLSKLYKEKAIVVGQNSCNSPALHDLSSFSDLLAKYTDSKELSSLYLTAERIGDENDGANCRLW